MDTSLSNPKFSHTGDSKAIELCERMTKFRDASVCREKCPTFPPRAHASRRWPAGMLEATCSASPTPPSRQGPRPSPSATGWRAASAPHSAASSRGRRLPQCRACAHLQWAHLQWARYTFAADTAFARCRAGAFQARASTPAAPP